MFTHNSPEKNYINSIKNRGPTNIHEIMIIKSILDGIPDSKVHLFGIITPYKPQVQLMKKIFAD
jgi:superfamily I DNA and/or RNA helicase